LTRDDGRCRSNADFFLSIAVTRDQCWNRAVRRASISFHVTTASSLRQSSLERFVHSIEPRVTVAIFYSRDPEMQLWSIRRKKKNIYISGFLWPILSRYIIPLSVPRQLAIVQY